MMRIVQLIRSMDYDRNVAAEVLALHNIFIKMGYEAYLVRLHYKIDESQYDGLIPDFTLESLTPDDVIVLHHVGKDLTGSHIARTKSRVIMRCHRIIDFNFFKYWGEERKKTWLRSVRQLRYYEDSVDLCVADSEQTSRVLSEMGYTCPIYTVNPHVPKLDDAAMQHPKTLKSPSCHLRLACFCDISPDEFLEIAIRAFAFYKIHFDKEAALSFYFRRKVGDYYAALQSYVDDLCVKGIEFHEINGSPNDLEKIEADVFLSHYDGVAFSPRDAYASASRIPFLRFIDERERCDDKDYLVFDDYKTLAFMVHRICDDDNLRNFVIERQHSKYDEFRGSRFADEFMRIFEIFEKRYE